MAYGVDVEGDGAVFVYRVSRGGAVLGERVRVGEQPVEVRVLRGRDYYEARAGCRFDPFLGDAGRDGMGGGWNYANVLITVSPLDLLKNPMILIAVVGLGFVVGMPYLMDSSMYSPPSPIHNQWFPHNSPNEHDG